MKKMFLLAACFLLTTSLAFSQTQQGQNQQVRTQAKVIHAAPTTCPNDPVLVSDGTEADNDLIAPASSAFYTVNAKGGHSYSVEVWDTYDPTAAVAPVITVTTDCSTSIGAQDVTTIDPDLSGGFSDRVSWIQGSSDQTLYIKVANPDQNNPYAYNIRVTDTTQINPRWSTYDPFDTYWGFTNTTNAPITGTLTVIDSTGSILTTITKTYPAGLFTQVSAKGNGVPKNHYGNAVFTYTGPAGAIIPDAVLIQLPNANQIVPYKFEGKHAYH